MKACSDSGTTYIKKIIEIIAKDSLNMYSKFNVNFKNLLF